jgi:Zn-finger nucleic acid-binding protein
MSERTCPRCDLALIRRRSGGHDVDVCPECVGVFLDQGEFDDLVAERFEGKRVESMFELIGEPVSDPLSCSECHHDMLRVEYDDVALDRCPECGGIWVDGNERREFARQAEEFEEHQRHPDLDDMVICAGCGNTELRRTCIKRMDQYWCEACVIAGNHPGPEAELARAKRAHKDAFRSMTHSKVRRESLKDAAAARRSLGRRGYNEAWLLRDLVETTARKIRELFNKT